MKRALLLCGAMLLLGAPAALAAAGVTLTWSTGGACWGETGSLPTLKTFACNSNSGNSQFVVSFATSADMLNFVGMSAILDGQSATAPLPDWWQVYNTGSCRSTALSVSANFLSAPGTICTDPWQNLGNGGVGAYQTQAYPPPPPLNVPAADRLRLKVAYVLTDSIPITGGQEYYGYQGTITNVKTVGTGACAGCATAVTLVLNEVQALRPIITESEIITAELHNRCINWQPGGVACAVVPDKNRTWGQIKSLYR